MKLMGAMLLVLVLDGAGYLFAIDSIASQRTALIAALEDIFVVVAMLTISVGLVLPGVIGQSAMQVSDAAQKLATGTLRDFSRAMAALGRGDLDAAYASVDITPVSITSHDELGRMAESFNRLQHQVKLAALGLVDARTGLQSARTDLTESNASLAARVEESTRLAEQLLLAKDAAEAGNAAKGQFLAKISH
jgi:methyl-accepting chemotaxis protein